VRAGRLRGARMRDTDRAGDRMRHSGIRRVNDVGLGHEHGELLLPQVTEVAALPGYSRARTAPRRLYQCAKRRQ
jgi:hypothetical protein